MKLYDEVEFLKEVLRIPSVNGVDDERKIARFLVDYLKKCGVDAMVQEIDSKHANVIAVLEGKTDEKVIWNGHLDTVPYGKITQWNTDPSEPVKKNGCIYARGASDMKSGLAAMVYTLGNMKQKGHIPAKTIYFFGTCDEEKGGLGAARILEEGRMKDASLLLIGEPTGCALGVAQKGCIWVRLKLYGKTSHGAYPEEGINAVEYGVQIFRELKARVEQHKHLLLGSATVQITEIKGGIAPNMTPDLAEIVFDIRTLPGMEYTEVISWLDEICGTYCAQTEQKLKTEIEVFNHRIPIGIDSDHLWVKKFEWEINCEFASSKKIGINYFTDASVLAKNIPELPVLLFGPGEPGMAHQPNEYVEIDKYLRYMKVLKRLF